MRIYMTDEQFEHAHRLLWLELAETGEFDKCNTRFLRSYCAFQQSYDRWTDNMMKTSRWRSCFACGEGVERCPEMDLNCIYCPIGWGKVKCESYGSPYYYWKRAVTTEKRKYWAGIIARLPWKRRAK